MQLGRHSCGQAEAVLRQEVIRSFWAREKSEGCNPLHNLGNTPALRTCLARGQPILAEPGAGQMARLDGVLRLVGLLQKGLVGSHFRGKFKLVHVVRGKVRTCGGQVESLP